MMPLERHKGAKLIWMENYTGKPSDKIHWEEPKVFNYIAIYLIFLKNLK